LGVNLDTSKGRSQESGVRSQESGGKKKEERRKKKEENFSIPCSLFPVLGQLD
jgi:membrane protein involved in colicin uptake